MNLRAVAVEERADRPVPEGLTARTLAKAGVIVTADGMDTVEAVRLAKSPPRPGRSASGGRIVRAVACCCPLKQERPLPRIPEPAARPCFAAFRRPHTAVSCPGATTSTRADSDPPALQASTPTIPTAIWLC